MPPMKTHIPGFIAGVVLGSALATAVLVSGPLSASAGADQTTAKNPDTAKIVFENDRVRVRDVSFPPGVTPMHTHKLPHVGVVIQGGTLVFKSPDGKSETMKLEPGGVGFREANVSHEPTNPGSSTVRVIEVELK
jgi:quercetin dioxygenase-like cupin family protein